MFEVEKRGYKKTEVDYYIKRLEDDFHAIIRNNTDKLEHVQRNLSEITQSVPEYKSEIESLRERLLNIRDSANKTSEARYLKDADTEVLLANLIMQILDETGDIEKLKPVISVPGQNDFFEILAGSKELKLDEALEGFDFFDNNPLREKAEKRLAKIQARKERRMAK